MDCVSASLPLQMANYIRPAVELTCYLKAWATRYSGLLGVDYLVLSVGDPLSPWPAAMTYLIWQCLKCGYALVAKEPPDRCPDCDAPREDFVLIDED